MKSPVKTLFVVALLLTAQQYSACQIVGPRPSGGPPKAPPADSPKGPTVTPVVGEGGIKLIQIPAGEFQMGSETGEPNEKPVHRVVISKPFWIGMYEVTQAQWRFVAEKLPRVKRDLNPSPADFQGDDLPVERVTWDDCQEFMARLNAKGDEFVYRLPTEAEWEYACRAGTTGAFAGNIESLAWGGWNSGERTHPVGLKRPNAWGLHDMHGNVWEHCSDRYSETYYSVSPSNDPTGPSKGSFRVNRGGSWYYAPWYCRSAHRSYESVDYRYSALGFRIVRVRK